MQQIGHYHNLKEIGSGGLARVYLGEHTLMHSKAAIKVLRPDRTDTEAFLREARIAVGLTHPNIVRILDCGIEDGTPFIVMDYAQYGSIRDYYFGRLPLSFELLLDYAEQVASAIQYIHNRAYIHGDIKSENLLLGPNGEVWLSDFGITTSIYTHSPTEATWGTVSHMAPELLCQPAEPCYASDQYALAVVVYEWLCGTLPFKGTKEEIIHQHLTRRPPSLRARASDIPQTVEDVVFKALAKRPDERFVSVQAFADALRDAFASHSFSANSGPLAPTIQVLSPVDWRGHGGVATLVVPAPNSTPSAPSAPSASLPPPIERVARVHPRSRWRRMSYFLAIDALVAMAVACLVTIFAMPPAIAEGLIILSLVLVPLVSAWLYKNRSLLLLTCCLTILAMAMALFYHSLLAFIVVYVGLLLLSLLITFSVSISDYAL